MGLKRGSVQRSCTALQMSFTNVMPRALCWLVNSPSRGACLSRSRTVGRVDQDRKREDLVLYG
ncbi:hypothetical protein I314_01330 [Cryptococcus bacillisporus CA1873]|uniref:Uncharacterized protein n=2 Tax=Cryptococcus gattii TaxID=552467 RepID=A0A0D0UMX2_CRYGA|nr:hypothetical protein I312_00591 [Cryptococcus bacillisporus CA1280]KIR68900.1 hypothetical protein I314_01330 [Cryptococcus bacillisporus CA1873]|eukprot:KIR68900.1 hypothetical protein I314_01330 [Cryptococcus gattii CA1873]